MDERRTPVAGVSVVTAAAVCLIAYSYLVGLWLDRHGHSSDLVLVVRNWVNRPTGVGEDFGFLGVALLLMVAGFTVAGIARSAGADRLPFAARLVRGGLPTVVVAAAVGALLTAVGAEPLVDPAITTPVGAVALFALVLLVLLPLQHRVPGLAVFVQLEVVCLLVLAGGWATSTGELDALRVIGQAAALVPLATLGQVAWLFRVDLLPRWHALVLGLLCLALVVLAERVFPETAAFWHPLAAVYALLLFLIALPRGASIAGTRVVRWLDSRALPLFASIPVVGYAVLGVQHLVITPAVAIPISLTCTCLAAELLHRCRKRLA
ncbi:hypothetical protein IOD16_36925 [Saccharothrix sp. 6-C]|uniref:hypothetical protein n=1 Tax=Saccharothrix sp. 6-C TaxID=2781735 RepID=UPI00191757F5|nr:hypothetical protein [Saccharothrix sp. 6-C]QQQ76521.1 hypothetical protein IOD16_36925 [Saccharothrix sp. 6-C]